MRLLLDQDVYAVTARFLSDMGHDAVPVAEIGLARAEDEEILHVAQEQGRILVTRDRDYGNLVFVQALGAGVAHNWQSASASKPPSVSSRSPDRARRADTSS